MFLYRDDFYNPDNSAEPGICEVEIAKHRNGPLGRAKLTFLKEYTRFGELAYGADNEIFENKA